jgi:hypothetical protein
MHGVGERNISILLRKIHAFHERRLRRQLTNAELETVVRAHASTPSKREKVKAMRAALDDELIATFGAG